MKINDIAISWIILASASIALADEPVMENTQLHSVEQVREMFQTGTTKEDTPALLRAMHQQRFSYKNMVQVLNLLQKAEMQGIPTEPIADKMFEGIAKNINPTNIVRAMTRVQNRYARAYRQAGELTANMAQVPDLGSIIAGAYTAGLTEEDCNKIQMELQTRTRTMNRDEAEKLIVRTMNLARVMARRNVAPSIVSDVLVGALQHSYKQQDMTALQNAFMERTRHEHAEAVAQHFSKEIMQGTKGDGLSRNSNRERSDRESIGSPAGSGRSSSGSGSSRSSAGEPGGSRGSSGTSDSGSSRSGSGSSDSGGGSSNESGGSGENSGGSAGGGSGGSAGGSSGGSGGSAGGSSGGSGGSAGGSSGGSGGSAGGSSGGSGGSAGGSSGSGRH